MCVECLNSLYVFTVAPMRGRGIARGLAAQANRHDNFRNRPPNTSRPPSMHVDDFMKLEQKSEQNRDTVPDDMTRRDTVCALLSGASSLSLICVFSSIFGIKKIVIIIKSGMKHFKVSKD